MKVMSESVLLCDLVLELDCLKIVLMMTMMEKRMENESLEMKTKWKEGMKKTMRIWEKDWKGKTGLRKKRTKVDSREGMEMRMEKSKKDPLGNQRSFGDQNSRYH